MNNRMWNVKNPHQGNRRKVLCVCSAGLLRSPTAAIVLSQPPFSYNTRAAGITADFALIPVDEVLLEWADEVVCMEKDHMEEIFNRFATFRKEIVVLDIPDSFGFMDETLQALIKERMLEAID